MARRTRHLEANDITVGIDLASEKHVVVLLSAQRRHLLALEEPGNESEAFIHRSTRSPRHPGAPQIPIV
jgi:hypothetical protein